MVHQGQFRACGTEKSGMGAAAAAAARPVAAGSAAAAEAACQGQEQQRHGSRGGEALGWRPRGRGLGQCAMIGLPWEREELGNGMVQLQWLQSVVDPHGPRSRPAG